MPVTSDAQQSRDAHLKQAFEKHLPRRIASIQRRTRALCDGGWDINTLHLIYSEVQQLAGSSGTYGMLEESEKLFALEVYLSSFTESGLIPDADQTAEIQRLVTELDELSDGTGDGSTSSDGQRRVSATVVSSAELPEPIIELNGLPSTANVPSMVVPPLDFLPFDELPESPLGDVGEMATEAGNDDGDVGEFSPDYVDPDIERLMVDDGEVSVGDIADRLVSDEKQLEILESDEVGESWMEDVELDQSTSTQDMVITSAESAALLDDEGTEVGPAESAAKPEAEAEEDSAADAESAAEADAEAEADGESDEELDLELDDASIDGLMDAAMATETDAAEAEDSSVVSKGDTNKMVALSKAKTVYFLRRTSKISDALVARMEPEYEVHSFDEIEEFCEILGALGPDVVMVDGSFIDEIEELGPLIKRIRAKQSGPMPMLAFSDDTDVATRLKILRAGADAFFPSDAPAEQVRQRLGELLQSETEDPFRVMIVEDDRSQAMFAQSILKKAGMQVFLERNPLKIMEALEQFRPDLILMDLYMPDCDGIELTAIIRERDEFVNTPIVFLSGEADTDKHFDALLAGGDDFLAKPIRPRHLISAVTNRVQRARMVQRRGAGPTRQDSVTGLVDRQVLLERINALLADLDKVDLDLPGGVLYIELDHPLDLRHEIGLPGFEELTAMMAPLLTEGLRKGEVCGRYGDNAYCILLPNRSAGSLEALAKDLVTSVGKHIFELQDATKTVTISIGICPLSRQLADAGAVIGAAERACNRDADKGNSRVGLATGVVDTVDEVEDEDDELVPLLEEAIERRHFQVLFQPIVSLQGDHNEQYQSLLRVVGADGRPIAASRFIPVAERHGLIVKMDRWVVSRALSVIDDRGRKGRPVRLFVNQSGPTVEQKENLPWVNKLIDTRGVDPKSMVLEFKLPDIVHRLKAAVHYVNGLREMGIPVALGGFDGSDSAFQVLEHLEVDYIKLPPASGQDGLPGMNIKEVVTRLHKLDKLVIIPSIEDAKTAARLWPTGVDFIQGNFVQPPEADLVYQF